MYTRHVFALYYIHKLGKGKSSLYNLKINVYILTTNNDRILIDFLKIGKKSESEWSIVILR